MNEKLKEFRKWLQDEHENAIGKVVHYSQTSCRNEYLEWSGEATAFSGVKKHFDEIFGASERSGVGENEEVQDVSDKLTCKNCGGKFPDSLTMQGHWCTH